MIVRDAEGEIVADSSLWGIEEDCGDYWREVAADLINGICDGVIAPASEEMEETCK